MTELQRGNRVVFDDDGSYVENKTTGQRTWMAEDGGMYTLKMWVSKQSTAEAGFGWPEVARTVARCTAAVRT